MTDRHYTTKITVAQDPAHVFAAVSNPRAWWSEEIEGPTDRVGATFDYHYQDLHRCEIRVDEMAPGKKVAWTIVDNFFSFTKDADEWKGTTIVFDIARHGDMTEVTFTHIGLLPSCECYSACSDGWGHYIQGSLKDLITTGQGQPNKGEAITESERSLAGNPGQSFTTEIMVDRSPEEVFAAINDVRAWWHGDIDGPTAALGDEFTYRYKEVHRSTQKLTELVPGRKVVWTVTDSYLGFVADKDEWTGTRIVFDIEPRGDRTRLQFTHEGLTPTFECFGGCSGAWSEITGTNLKNLIEAGKA